MSYGSWPAYIPVAKRRQKAAQAMKKLRKKGLNIEPVEIQGRKIARTFWAKAWCTHLEGFGDYANRLPRGRTYVRNGSVCHLSLSKGHIDARVSGSSLYTVEIDVTPLRHKRWQTLKKECRGQIGSLLELLQGTFSKHVMSAMIDLDKGLLPQGNEIKFCCSCPDSAWMCKHIAAVLYGVGARLDDHPEMLFLLRGVDHEELIDVDFESESEPELQASDRHIADTDLGAVFGIDIGVDTDNEPSAEADYSETVKRDNAKAKAKAGNKSAQKSIQSVDSKPYTAARIKRLRKKLELDPPAFARLLGVHLATVLQWEKTRGKLNLRPRSIEALDQAGC